MEKREKNYKKLKRSGVGADGVSETHLQKRNTPKNRNKPKKALNSLDVSLDKTTNQKFLLKVH